ncbi:MAG: SufE family protein [Verrucomicrobiales bacterium]|nr:SufE family protein [Verrucomicrobiales bacterium]
MSYPSALQELIDFFEGLSEGERRENLIGLAENASSFRPEPGESFDLTDVRKDQGCTDTVGLFLRVEAGGRVHFAVELGPKVQTLTRAMTTLLCRGLNGATLEEVLEISPDFVPRLIGEELVRLRSQTVYYVLSRMKQAAAEARRGERSFLTDET